MEDIKDKFFALAIEHGNAINKGDSKKANNLHSKIMKLYKKLKEQNNYFPFLDGIKQENESIRHWSSVFLIRYDPALAEENLNELVRLNSIISLNAQLTLDLWKKNLLNL
jgi:hypothetical protein